MSDEALARHLAGLPLAGLTYLNLHNCALKKIENLQALRGLKVSSVTCCHCDHTFGAGCASFVLAYVQLPLDAHWYVVCVGPAHMHDEHQLSLFCKQSLH